MKILMTGAEVEQCGNEFQVIYQNQIVFSHRIRQCAIMVALDKQQLNDLIGMTNLYKFRVG